MMYMFCQFIEDVSVVEWYNQRLPCAGPGFDSRPIHWILVRLFTLFSPGYQ